MTNPATTPQLIGFSGFAPLSELPIAEVPRGPGVYVVLGQGLADPVFLDANRAGRFKGKDPSLAAEVLAQEWVPAASVVYIGKAAGGASGRRGLRKRLEEYRRHGAGEPGTGVDA